MFKVHGAGKQAAKKMQRQGPGMILSNPGADRGKYVDVSDVHKAGSRAVSKVKKAQPSRVFTKAGGAAPATTMRNRGDANYARHQIAEREAKARATLNSPYFKPSSGDGGRTIVSAHEGMMSTRHDNTAIRLPDSGHTIAVEEVRGIASRGEAQFMRVTRDENKNVLKVETHKSLDAAYDAHGEHAKHIRERAEKAAGVTQKVAQQTPDNPRAKSKPDKYSDEGRAAAEAKANKRADAKHRKLEAAKAESKAKLDAMDWDADSAVSSFMKHRQTAKMATEIASNQKITNWQQAANVHADAVKHHRAALAAVDSLIPGSGVDRPLMMREHLDAIRHHETAAKDYGMRHQAGEPLPTPKATTSAIVAEASKTPKITHPEDPLNNAMKLGQRARELSEVARRNNGVKENEAARAAHEAAGGAFRAIGQSAFSTEHDIAAGDHANMKRMVAEAEAREGRSKHGDIKADTDARERARRMSADAEDTSAYAKRTITPRAHISAAHAHKAAAVEARKIGDGKLAMEHEKKAYRHEGEATRIERDQLSPKERLQTATARQMADAVKRDRTKREAARATTGTELPVPIGPSEALQRSRRRSARAQMRAEGEKRFEQAVRNNPQLAAMVRESKAHEPPMPKTDAPKINTPQGRKAPQITGQGVSKKGAKFVIVNGRKFYGKNAERYLSAAAKRGK